MASRPSGSKSQAAAVLFGLRPRNEERTYAELDDSGDGEPKKGGDDDDDDDDDADEDLMIPRSLFTSRSASLSSQSLSNPSSGSKSRKRGRGTAPLHPMQLPESRDDDMEDVGDGIVLPPSFASLSSGVIKVLANFINESKDVITTAKFLLAGPLSSLHTFSTEMVKVSGLLDSIFTMVDIRQDELAREICTQLGLNYDLPVLKRFLALVDTNREKVKARVSRNTYIVLSLINNRETMIGVANVAANAELSVAKAASYDAKRLTMPSGSSPLQIQKEVDKEQRGKARKSTASPLGLSSSSSSSSSTGGEEGSSVGVGGGGGSAIGSSILSRRHISLEGAIKLAQRIYGDSVLWSEQDLGNIEKADTIVCASFPVCALGGVVPRNFHKNGFSSGFSFAIGGEKALVKCLDGQGRNVITLDLCSTPFPADAFDKAVPASARSMMRSMANLLVGLNPQDIFGLGVHTNKALDAAAIALHGDGIFIEGVQRTHLYGGSRKRSRNSSSLSSSSSSSSTSSSSMSLQTDALSITHLQHPTAFSTFLCGNIASLAAAGYYDEVFKDLRVSFRGLVLLRGLRGDDGKGGALGAAFGLRSIEILSGTPTPVLPMAVEAFALSKKLTNDDEASVYLNENGKCALDLPHSRLAAFLQNTGLKGGLAEAVLFDSVFDSVCTEFASLRRGGLSEKEKAAADKHSKTIRDSFRRAKDLGGGFESVELCVSGDHIAALVLASGLALEQVLAQLSSLAGRIRGGRLGNDYLKEASSTFQAASPEVQSKAMVTAAATAKKVIASNAPANGTIKKATEKALITEGVPKGDAEQISVIAAIQKGAIIGKANTEKILAPKRIKRGNFFNQIALAPTAPTIDSSTIDLTKDEA